MDAHNKPGFGKPFAPIRGVGFQFVASIRASRQNFQHLEHACDDNRSNRVREQVWPCALTAHLDQFAPTRDTSARSPAESFAESSRDDIDLADDIRRSVTRSVAEFDAPQLGLLGELHGPSEGVLLPTTCARPMSRSSSIR